MSVDGWKTILVLGGIRSGKSEFAASLLRDQTTVRCALTAAGHPDGQDRAVAPTGWQRPPSWTVVQVGADPGLLVELIASATPDETLLVDDLSGWVAGLLSTEHEPAGRGASIDRLATAVRDCRARLVLVSPEAGLTPTAAMSPSDRAYVDLLGTANQVLARVCDAAALVVAGQPIWLQPATGRPRTTVPQPTAVAASAPADVTPPAAVLRPDENQPAEAADPWTAPTAALPIVTTGPVIEPNMDLPLPDEEAAARALTRLASLDFPGAGLGNFDRVVRFAAGTQATAAPTPWRSVRVLLLHGDHEGGVAAGTVPGESVRRANQARAGEGVLARLAAEAGATLHVVSAPTAAPIEQGSALAPAEVESALRLGWRLAEEAVDEGADLLVLASCGAGTDAAAAAVIAATSGAEPVAVLSRVVAVDGTFDDAAWMTRCAAVRDALHRTRRSPRAAKDVLAELGGGDFAIATGILLGATARRTPVLVDGPVGVAAALVSRGLAGQARHWCLLPDHNGHPAVRYAADVLGLEPLFDLRLDLGEGATSLAALPMLRAALNLAATTPPVTGTAAEAAGVATDAEFVEPEPAGPGPTSPTA